MIDIVESVFEFSPAPKAFVEPIRRGAIRNGTPEHQATKPADKAWRIRKLELRTLLRKFFDECDVAINRFEKASTGSVA